MRIEPYELPAAIMEQVLAIAREASLDLSGIEYLVNDRDGHTYFFDVNALSNFVTDAERILGFNPHKVLVDFLTEDRIKRAQKEISTLCRPRASTSWTRMNSRK